jgi:hypothetical protein
LTKAYRAFITFSDAGGNMRIRKQDYHLTLADLIEFPVWEYTLDEEGDEGREERTVRPYLNSPSLDPDQAYFIVRASFRLADGTRMTGYIKPITLSDPGLTKPLVPADMDPIIVTERGQVPFWYGASKPGPEEISKNYQLLNKEPSDVFPIEFASDIEVLDSIGEGRLEGFLSQMISRPPNQSLKPTTYRTGFQGFWAVGVQLLAGDPCLNRWRLSSAVSRRISKHGRLFLNQIT